jgi:hypothetical protein
MLDIIDDYYKIGDTVTGDSVAAITANNYIEQVNYFEQFTGDKAQLVSDNYQLAIAVLERLNMIAQKYQRAKIIQMIQPIMVKVYNNLMQQQNAQPSGLPSIQ